MYSLELLAIVGISEIMLYFLSLVQCLIVHNCWQLSTIVRNLYITTDSQQLLSIDSLDEDRNCQSMDSVVLATEVGEFVWPE